MPNGNKKTKKVIFTLPPDFRYEPKDVHSELFGIKKWLHLNLNGAICCLVTSTSVSSNTFIDDLVRLSQIKIEL